MKKYKNLKRAYYPVINSDLTDEMVEGILKHIGKYASDKCLKIFKDIKSEKLKDLNDLSKEFWDEVHRKFQKGREEDGWP